jgi:predicted dehydrogenase
MDGSPNNAVVVGFGSIGARHATVLEELGLSVSVVSRRDVDLYPGFTDIAQAIEHDPGTYVVIANETSQHHTALAALRESGHTGPVLVEKPLFAYSTETEDGELEEAPERPVFVGYNLRFHPLVAALRDRLAGRKVHTIEAMVGQYLPDWRPQRDYRDGYGAWRDDGGGALRDLSHEIDYMQWLFGPWESVAALTGQTGLLEIETEDFAHLLVRGRDFKAATIGLDYLDRNVRRAITVQHDHGTTRLDFVAGTLTENGELYLTTQLDRNETYRLQHLAVLNGETGTGCTLREGLVTLRAIEAAEEAAESGKWVSL